MDSHHATIVGKVNGDDENFEILGYEKSAGNQKNSNENIAHNLERDELHKLFKSITAHMQNVDEIHVTGTGVVQEQFIKYLAETPQYKNAEALQSTSNKMSDDKLVEYISSKFN